MTSPFSKFMDYAVSFHFRKDRSGRLVFLPLLSRRGKGYFVDSKSDEEKIKAFVKMYRSANTLLPLLCYLSISLPGFILNVYAGANPLRTKLEVLAGSSLVFLLFYVVAAWMLWNLYKKAIPSFTSSLSEVGPDVMGQLVEISYPRRRLIVLCLLFAGIALLGVAILVTRHPSCR